ncbi:helix-turn-helix domain-containing protein [Piscibacillus halophilus]|uniref:DNA-binding transcriptional regulator, ArsR family n=1 Tax=Piscibacillus halophilus TaxID=571933 RepID=A0A1H9DSQ8_9BACI|nr:helix-turn-helix domain-containing protein [Piscibacillus halophilus]SEQ16495.1 DNA-binding transcriptional regulator, ArsR family [Piscibacillus halophilus]
MNENDITLVFKALAHPVRRRILDYVKNNPSTTGELVSHFPDISRYAVMKHLKTLEDSQLILSRKEGRLRINYLNVVPLQTVHNRWVSQYEELQSENLLSLKNQIEGGRQMTGLVHDSFKIEQEIKIKGSREEVFNALTTDISKWWTYSAFKGENTRLTLDATPGGLFMETNEDGGALWGTVTYVKENQELRLNGLLGMKGAVDSAYSYKLEEDGEYTILKLSHHAVGLLDPEWHQMHDEGWQELLDEFLKDYVENGKVRA